MSEFDEPQTTAIEAFFAGCDAAVSSTDRAARKAKASELEDMCRAIDRQTGAFQAIALDEPDLFARYEARRSAYSLTQTKTKLQEYLGKLKRDPV